MRYEAATKGNMCLNSWVKILPQPRFLSIPGQGMEYTVLLHLGPGENMPQIQQLEQLELTSDPRGTQNFSTGRLISRIVASFPNLWQIRLYEAYAEFDDVWADCQDAEIVLKKRQNKVAGHVVHDPEEAGVSFFY